MIILGLNTFIRNPAACILIDGKLIAFAEEERFIRIKGANGFFPTQSIRYCLKEAGIQISEVDTIAIGWDNTKYKYKMPLFFARSWLQYGLRIKSSHSFATIINELINQQPKTIKQKVLLNLKNIGLSNKIPPIEFVSHHLAHAASTYYASGFKKATILVIDGSGEEHATSSYIGDGKKIKKIDHINIPDSLGWFYAAFSAYTGFTPYQEDGYLMGLAPYGKFNKYINDKISRILSIDKQGKYCVNPLYTLLGTHTYNEFFSDELVNLLGAPRTANELISKRHKDIAYAVQNHLEKSALSITRKTVDKTRVKHLCLAGGVALNCKMNGVILRSKIINKLFIQPVSHDAGATLGAAMIVAEKNGEDPRFEMTHSKWGPKFSPSKVKKILDSSGISYKKPHSIEQKAAEAIASGKIVAWFNGRMEAGPRALGARSILANATKTKINDYINNKIKHRDPWRPFCPSFTKNMANNYYDGGKESIFMIVAYPINKSRQQEIPAVVHIDGTIRPQVVDEKIEPKFHSLIKTVGEKTGVPAVLNTSFNVKGEPIVCTPQDALRCFASTGIDALAIEDFWIEKSTLSIN